MRIDTASGLQSLSFVLKLMFLLFQIVLSLDIADVVTAILISFLLLTHDIWKSLLL